MNRLMNRLITIPASLALCGACSQTPATHAPRQDPPAATASPASEAQGSFVGALDDRDEVAPDRVQSWRTSHTSVRMVDVRESAELTGELGHIEGVEHVPLAELPNATANWDKQAQLVLVCKSGRRSGMAAEQLKAQGFTHVASMAGGMQRWNEQGLPVRR